MADPRYPVGPWVQPKTITTSDRARSIDEIAAAPGALRQAVKGLTEAQIETPYRDGGWTVRQVVHHVPDSHIHAYIRMKFALTENEPQVKPYEQTTWAETPEIRTTSIDVSLTLLEALHARWVQLLRGMSPSDFARVVNHPEWTKPLSLDMMAAHYAWHGRHHVGHITELRKAKGW